MKKEKSLTRRKGEPYPLEIRLAAIGEYRLGVSRKEIAFKSVSYTHLTLPTT